MSILYIIILYYNVFWNDIRNCTSNTASIYENQNDSYTTRNTYHCQLFGALNSINII